MARFNPPPNWPPPPDGWTPHEGWQPDPAWGPPPDGWQFWTDGPVPPASAPPPPLPPPPPPLAVRPAGSRSAPGVLGWIGIAVFLALAIGATASTGLSGALVLVGLATLVVGAVAGIRGGVAWARLATRRAGWFLAVAGLIALCIGGAIAPPASNSPTKPRQVAQKSESRAFVAVPTTAKPVPTTPASSPTTTTATAHPTAKASPSATPTKSKPISKPKPKPISEPKPKPVKTTPPPVHHSCTRTGRGTCIQGGEFCPKMSYGSSGYDAAGRRYVCEGPDHSHPHWEKP
jgi:hypothetical protein